MDQTKINKGIGATANFIRDNKKPLFYIGASVLVVVIAITAIKGLKSGFGDFFKTKADVKGSGNFLEQPVDQGKTSITPVEAKNYAEQLFNAMKKGGPIYGTDKATIGGVFDKINPEDFKMVYNAFGRRSYADSGTPSGLSVTLGLFDDLDLVEWLNKELDFLDYALKNKVRPIVSGAGFAF